MLNKDKSITIPTCYLLWIFQWSLVILYSTFDLFVIINNTMLANWMFDVLVVAGLVWHRIRNTKQKITFQVQRNGNFNVSNVIIVHSLNLIKGILYPFSSVASDCPHLVWRILFCVDVVLGYSGALRHSHGGCFHHHHRNSSLLAVHEESHCVPRTGQTGR